MDRKSFLTYGPEFLDQVNLTYINKIKNFQKIINLIIKYIFIYM